MLNGATHAVASQIDTMRAQSGSCAEYPTAAPRFVRKMRPGRPRRPLPPAVKPASPAQAAIPATHRRQRQECAALARALHDDLAQLLSYALIQLDIAHAAPPDATPCRDAALRHGRDLIKDALRTTRDVIGGLLEVARPTAPTFDAQCLMLAGDMGRLARQAIDVDCAPITAAPPAPVCKVLLGAARELLANACKHAPGAHVVLTLRQETQTAGTCTVLTVSDDGPGFDPAALRRMPRGHFGLRQLPAMLAQIGAVFTLESRPGTGVRAQIRWFRPTEPR